LRAFASKRYGPISTVTLGCLRRLWYQSGLSGEPPFDAMTTKWSPSRVYASGLVRVCPVRAPFVVSSRSDRPVNGPFVICPPCARKSAMTASLKPTLMQQRASHELFRGMLSGEPGEIRTLGQGIKSPLLYR